MGLSKKSVEFNVKCSRDIVADETTILLDVMICSIVDGDSETPFLFYRDGNVERLDKEALDGVLSSSESG